MRNYFEDGIDITTVAKHGPDKVPVVAVEWHFTEETEVSNAHQQSLRYCYKTPRHQGQGYLYLLHQLLDELIWYRASNSMNHGQIAMEVELFERLEKLGAANSRI
jgi:hypothetical protein